MTRRIAVQFAQVLTVISLVVLPNLNMHAADNPEAALKNWADFLHGGVWRTTVNDQKHEHRYETVYDGRLQIGETVDAGVRAKLVVGIDPQSGNCRFWQFGSDGCVTIFDLKEMDHDTWILTGSGNGPKGKTRYRSRITRTGPNSTQEEMLEYVLNGTKQPTTVRIWNRTKE